MSFKLVKPYRLRLSPLISGAVYGAALASTMALAAPAWAEETKPADAPAVTASKPVILAPAALPEVADLAEQLLPAVVEISIQSKQGDEESSNSIMPDLPDNSPFKDFFDDFLKKRQGKGEDDNSKKKLVNSMGSGFVVDPSGLIVTNNHVVEDAVSIEVHFQDSTTLKGELVGRDAKTDLAVIRVKPAKPLTAVAFGDSDKVRVGQWVMAIGNPFGLGGSVSLGIVSARNRDINAGPYDDFIQTDAAINKGNSGGPLFNMKGEVVGINTAIFSPTGGSVGIGFSVPSNTAKNVVSQLEKYGETRRGWLGVKIQSVTADIAESMGLGSARGALIADVTKDGPAAKAGFEAGDVVIDFNNHPIKEMKDLPKMVAETEVGAKVPVKVMRQGKEVVLQVEIGRLENNDKTDEKKPDAPAAENEDAGAALLGMKLNPITDALKDKYKLGDDVKGVVITEVEDGSAAQEKMLEAGDVITEAGEKPVKDVADIKAAIEAAEKDKRNSVLLLVAKAGKPGDVRFVALKLKK